MEFRYFDASGRQLTVEQLCSMQVLTPAMNHVFATVLERMEKREMTQGPIEKDPLE